MQSFDIGASAGQVVDGVVPPRLRDGLRCAVNEEFVEMERVLQDGDIVDLLPPFGGG
jgi:molybdopterin converting factor small subunit